MPQLLTGGNRPPLWPGGPMETLQGTPDPEWGPFVVPAHLRPGAYSPERTEQVLGNIANVLGIEPPVIVPADPLMN